MTFALCFLGAFYLIGISLLVLARRNAPEGYEDETGFHYSSETVQVTSSAARKAEPFRLRPASIRPLGALSSLTRVESRPETFPVRHS